VPDGMCDGVLATTRFVREDGMVEATRTILGVESDALGEEMGFLAGRLDYIGYDVKFLRGC